MTLRGDGQSESETNVPEASDLHWSSGLRSSGRPRVAVDVLVIDDNEDIRTSLAEILGRSGCSVAVAADGESALYLLQQIEVGVVILDLRTRHMEGIAFLEALDVAPPVAVPSAQSLDEELRARLGSKLVTHLQKPVDSHHLVTVVASTVGCCQ